MLWGLTAPQQKFQPKQIKKMNRLLALVICLLTSLMHIDAVPANGIPFVVKQSDGSELQVRLFGDEGFHFFKTQDDVPIVRETDDFFYYAALGDDGKIVSSGILAHERENRTAFEITFINSNFNAVVNSISKQWNTSFEARNSTFRHMTRQHSHKVIGVSEGYFGNKKGLVILVNFANLSMYNADSQQIFSRMFNETGYADNGHIGSVHDYFHDQSYGKFSLTFDVVGPMTLANDYGYYGRNIDIVAGADANPREMVIEACRYADDFVDFKDYDWDGDGEVDQVFIVYAGYGEHSGAPGNTIWPHESSLGSQSITLDGVRINTYACSSEFIGNSGKTLSGIGTACHEFSHCLGFPDLYDTDYSGGFGMRYWDVMDSGSYSGLNGTGEIPYGYSAYEKWQAGWLAPVEINETTKDLHLGNLGDTPSAYILYNEGNRNEFFILENHQANKWYSCLSNHRAQHGLMVTHIDYSAQAWMTNTVNQYPNHQRFTIVPADNSYGLTIDDLMGDLYPGTKNVTALTNTSHVSSGSLLFNPNSDNSKYLNRTLCNIKEEDGVVSLDILVGKDVIPIVLEATDASDEGFTANWSDIPDAESYTLSYTTIISIFPLVVKNKVVKDISDTKHFIAWDEDAISCTYRVQAVIHGVQSPWSGDVTVRKENASSISTLMSNENFSPTFYLMNGVRTNKAQKGVNLMRDKNGRVRKIIR